MEQRKDERSGRENEEERKEEDEKEETAREGEIEKRHKEQRKNTYKVSACKWFPSVIILRGTRVVTRKY